MTNARRLNERRQTRHRRTMCAGIPARGIGVYEHRNQSNRKRSRKKCWHHENLLVVTQQPQHRQYPRRQPARDHPDRGGVLRRADGGQWWDGLTAENGPNSQVRFLVLGCSGIDAERGFAGFPMGKRCLSAVCHRAVRGT